MTPAFLRRAVPALLALAPLAMPASADAQVVYYEAYRPVVVAPMVAAPAYVTNYVPAGNYAAVTAFSPPVVMAIGAAYPPVAAPIAMTTYYAPAAAPVATTAYYAAPVAEAVVAQPVTAAYAPVAVAVPLRRGIFGGYRPVRPAWYIPY